jgi:hypothetical protein
MLGLILIFAAALMAEIGTSIGKWEVNRHRESTYTMGFLNTFWATVILAIFAFLLPVGFFAPGFPGGFVFTAASLPTFIPMLILGIVQAHVSTSAITHADRSTYGFLRLLTIPLLLLSDIVLSYSVTSSQLVGMGLMMASFFLLLFTHGIRTRGAGPILFTAVNGAVLIALYKYNIAHYNSVEAVQLIGLLGILFYFFVMAVLVARENPIRYLRRPIFFLESAVMGVAEVAGSFSYLYGTASVLSSAERALSTLFAIVAGKMYFKEGGQLVKILCFVLIATGLYLLTL